MTPIDAEKKMLRMQMAERRQAMTGEQREAADKAIFEALIADPVFQEAKQVFAYVSMPHEVDTAPLMRYCLEHGKTLALPICAPRNQMAFYQLKAMDELRPGQYRIPIPPIAKDRRCIADHHTLLIVPMLAFDEAGYRLGAGGGYYDRWLSQHIVHTIGICYENGRTAALPHDKYDQKVDRIITEAAWKPAAETETAESAETAPAPAAENVSEQGTEVPNGEES